MNDLVETKPVRLQLDYNTIYLLPNGMRIGFREIEVARVKGVDVILQYPDKMLVVVSKEVVSDEVLKSDGTQEIEKVPIDRERKRRLVLKKPKKDEAAIEYDMKRITGESV